MLKFQQRATPEDLKIAASIEHRRRVEEARKPRIFDPRARKIGIDKAFLDEQVEEKQRQRERERAQECQLDEALVRGSQLAAQLERQQQEERRKINKEIESFRRVHQRPEDRRDYDLYDPEALKKAFPSQANDDDPDLGTASAQKFEGEDRNLHERLRAQRQQLRWWFQQQKEEREAAERMQREIEDAYQEAIVSRDKRAATLAQMEEECRRRLNEDTAKFNRALLTEDRSYREMFNYERPRGRQKLERKELLKAEEQQQRRRHEAVQEEEDNKAEIYNHVTGDFLTEAKEQAESTRGPQRPLMSRYKGMTADELKVFRSAQLEQMRELQSIRQAEKRTSDDWDRQMTSHLQAANSYQCELNRRKQELNKQIAEENLRLAEEQRSQQDYLNRVVYKNEPTSAFYEQFNTGTR